MKKLNFSIFRLISKKLIRILSIIYFDIRGVFAITLLSVILINLYVVPHIEVYLHKKQWVLVALSFIVLSLTLFIIIIKCKIDNKNKKTSQRKE